MAYGEDADARTDIFAFGAVLFEMVTGRRAFAGKSQASLLGAILKEQPPPLSQLQPVSPATLDYVVRTCLAKDPDDRFQSARDLRLQLEWMKDGSLTAGTPAPAIEPSRTRDRVWMAAAAVVGLAGIGAAAWVLVQPKPLPDAVRFTVAPPERSTFATPPGFLAVSPDGRRLAFVAATDGKSQLWVRAIDSLTPQLLPGTDGASQPAWLPNSRFVAFRDSASSKLKKADAMGGALATLAECAGTVAWNGDGVMLCTGRDARLYRIRDNGGQAVAVTDLDSRRQETGHLWPIFLPDGRRFIFLAQSSDRSKSALFLSSLDSPSRTRLVDVLSSVAYAQGHLFYQRDGTLMAHPFDEEAGRLTEDAAPVIEDIQYNPANGRAAFSVSTNGTLVYRAGGRRTATLTWFDRQGKPVGHVSEPGTYSTPQLSRDGH